MTINVQMFTQKIPVFHFLRNCHIGSTNGDVKNCTSVWKNKTISTAVLNTLYTKINLVIFVFNLGMRKPSPWDIVKTIFTRNNAL